MKKIIVILTAIVLLSIVTMFVGCGCDHEFGEWTVESEPTCTEAGIEARICSKCDAREEQEIEVAEHEYGKWTVSEKATCEKTGLRTRQCSVCDTVDEEEIEKTDHKYGAGKTEINATCTREGRILKTCKDCGFEEYRTVSVKDHKWVDANCQNPKTCSECSKTEGEIGTHVFANATCTAPSTCTVCGTTEGSALGHTMSAATCETPATCSVCGITDGDAPGHQWSGGSCTTESTCSVCGASNGAAPGHSPDSAFKCTRCGGAMTAADYKYFAANDFRGEKSRYSTATPECAYTSIYTDSQGDNCVMTWVWYRIGGNLYSIQTLHNLTRDQKITDPGDYFKRLANQYVGVTKLAILEVRGDALGALANIKTNGVYSGPEELY